MQKPLSINCIFTKNYKISFLPLQLWAGEEANYSCKTGKKLFQTSNESGLASITIQCLQFGHLTPWWFPATLPNCLANLTENTTFIAQSLIGNFFLPFPVNLLTVKLGYNGHGDGKDSSL